MNARYGWGVKGGTDGASQRFHRQFWDAVFGEYIAEIGKANHDSKEDNLNLINRDCNNLSERDSIQIISC